MASLTDNEKYRLYESSVQAHENDIDFINEEFKRERKRSPLVLREDFGGTGAMACDWVKQSAEHKAYAVDLDESPVRYGKETHFSRLSKSEQRRMHYVMGNVLEKRNFKADVIAAFNFSYFIFKKRQELLEYFKRVYEGLNNEGAFFLDIFGGTEGFQELEEETEHDGHTYFWDCDRYNVLTGECQYYIHFKIHSENEKYERVFSYDWRMWTLPEIKDLLYEAGFRVVHTYWEEEEDEEDDEDGEGNGVFYRSENEENCESWVTYLMALK